MAANPPRKVSFGLGSGYFGGGRKLIKTFSVTRSWKKFAFSVPLKPASDNAYFFVMETSGGGVVFLDAVSLRPGNEDVYEPAALAEVGFLRNHIRPIVYKGDKATLFLCAVNHAPTNAETTVVSTDYWGREQQLDSFQIAAGDHASAPK